MPTPRKTDPDYLHWRFLRAISDERWPTFQKLLEQHPELVNTVSQHGLALETALWGSPRLKTIQMLLQAGADPNLTDPERPWSTPLRAALQRLEEAVPLLLEAGARPGSGDSTSTMFHNRYSDLHLAITHCPHHIRALEQAGARYDERDADGQYPISVLMGTMLGKVHPHAHQQTLKHIGYNPSLSSNPDALKALFSSKVVSKQTVWQTTEELESLVDQWWLKLTLPAPSSAVSSPRPRM